MAQPRYCERWLASKEERAWPEGQHQSAILVVWLVVLFVFLERPHQDSTKVQFHFPFHSSPIPLPWRILTTSFTIPIGSALDQQHSQWHLCAAGAGLMTQLCNSQWHNCAAGVRRRAMQNCTCAAAARHQHCHGFAAHTNMARVRHACSFQAMGNHEHSSMAKLVTFLGTSAGCLAAAALLKSHLPEPKQQSQQRADWDDGEGTWWEPWEWRIAVVVVVEWTCGRQFCDGGAQTLDLSS